jgi:hypothetical protein
MALVEIEGKWHEIALSGCVVHDEFVVHLKSPLFIYLSPLFHKILGKWALYGDLQGFSVGRRDMLE